MSVALIAVGGSVAGGEPGGETGGAGACPSSGVIKRVSVGGRAPESEGGADCEPPPLLPVWEALTLSRARGLGASVGASAEHAELTSPATRRVITPRMCNPKQVGKIITSPQRAPPIEQRSSLSLHSREMPCARGVKLNPLRARKLGGQECSVGSMMGSRITCWIKRATNW